MAEGPTGPAIERYVTGTGQVLGVHALRDCSGPPCTIHSPSGHVMRDFPTHWRADRRIMERICPHGIGHPDPDSINADDTGIHGCDGCCYDNREGAANG